MEKDNRFMIEHTIAWIVEEALQHSEKMMETHGMWCSPYQAIEQFKTVVIKLPRQMGITSSIEILLQKYPNALLFCNNSLMRDMFIRKYEIENNQNILEFNTHYITPEYLHNRIKIQDINLVIFDSVNIDNPVARMAYDTILAVCNNAKLFVRLG